jgi:hypothetical protein
VCKEILGPEQLAYLDGRSMEDGQAVINRALELFRKKELKGLTACIDFRAAFDSCKHEFMWQTLERLNVGPNLIACVKTLYNGAKCRVLNFNSRTNWFPLSRSTRQGDLISGYAFIFVFEVLLNRIRRKIPSLDTLNFSVQFIVYADDFTVFLRNVKDLKRLIRLINDFSPVSGLRINLDKSGAAFTNFSKLLPSFFYLCFQVQILARVLLVARA